MTVLIADEHLAQRLIEERRARGIDRPDEVWDGVYVIMPPTDNVRQELVGEFGVLLDSILEDGDRVYFGINVSDRGDDWEFNYRCPNLAVYLKSNPAENRRTHYCGGPDLAIEIIGLLCDDRTREKPDFYAMVGTRELLIIDRDPWALELYRLQGGTLKLHGESSLEAPQPVGSDVLPLTWRLIPGDARPRIEVTHGDGRQWVV